MSEALPIRTFDATDPHALWAWVEDLRDRYGDDEAFKIVVDAIGGLGRNYQRLAAALLAKGRGQRQGGSEAFGRQATIAWAERAEERIAEPESREVSAPTESGPGDSAARSETRCQAEEASEGESGAEPQPRGHRQAFPASWPRVPRLIRVEGSQRICQVCGKEKRCIGHVQSELLAIKPAEIYVLQAQREKLVCPDEHEGVVTAPAVPRLVEQSACDLSMSLDLLDRKLVQHQPIYRVQQVYARLGASVAEATLDRWYADALDSLCIVARCIRAATTDAERFRLNIDEETIPILDRDAPDGRIIGHLWLVIGDGRFVAARASRDWKKEHAIAAVGAWEGYLQADAYRGFDGIYRTGRVIEVGCWAHARRYFVKAKDRGDKLAEEALGLIARVYAVEAEADRRGLAPEERLELRNDRSRRALDLLWVWTRKVGARVRPRSPLGKALRTLANQRTALLRFLEDGRLPVDNTSVEREMKPIILGRKNWLFAGNFRGAERLADGITVIATARLHGPGPVDYLRWLLPQLARREWSEAAAAAQLTPEHFQAFLDRQQGQHSEIAAHEGQ
jgi:transposase